MSNKNSVDLFANTNIVFENHNPFATTVEAQPTEETLAMVKRGPAVDAAEVEVATENAVEVRIAWGSTVLLVTHLTQGRGFTVGETGDFVIAADKLGCESAPVVTVENGESFAVVFENTNVTVNLPNVGQVDLDQAKQAGVAMAMPEFKGAYRIALTRGTRVRFEREDLVFVVASVAAGKKTKASLFSKTARPAFLMAGLSLLAHLGVVGGLAFFKPNLDSTEDETARADNQLVLRQLLNKSAEKEEERRETEANPESNGSKGGPGVASPMQNSAPAKQTQSPSKTYSMPKGPVGGQAGQSDRGPGDEIAAAREFGVLAFLQAMGPSNNSQFAVPNGNDSILPSSFWSDTTGPLSLSQTTDGPNEGINSKGPGDNFSKIPGSNIPRGPEFTGEHQTFVPKITPAPVVPNKDDKNVSKDVIQRLVRQNFGRIRMCYEDGLRGNPSLSGRVVVNFMIGRDGAVKSSSASGDLPASVNSCVARSFYGISFPSPENGVISVSYPISMSVTRLDF